MNARERGLDKGKEKSEKVARVEGGALQKGVITGFGGGQGIESERRSKFLKKIKKFLKF